MLSDLTMATLHKFYKSNGNWYIDLPNYPGPKADLEMVAGADTMLDVFSGNGKSVDLFVSENSVAGFDELIKLDKNDVGSGAYYLMKNYEGKEVNHEMWLCDVTAYVFGNFPDKIYIKRSINSSND
jgi:hypothetical protein